MGVDALCSMFLNDSVMLLTKQQNGPLLGSLTLTLTLTLDKTTERTTTWLIIEYLHDFASPENKKTSIECINCSLISL
jgi:hypothetical protein